MPVTASPPAGPGRALACARGRSRTASWLIAAGLLLGACRGDATRVVVAYPDLPVDPHPHFTGSEYAQSINANVYESLLVPDGELGFEPRLAASWHTSDERTWVFEIRDDVRFHDGQALTAADVVRSLDVTRRDPRAFYRDAVEQIERVRALGPHVLEVTTTRPLGNLPRRLGMVAIVGEAPEGEPPPGTGPYRVEAFEPGRRIRLRAFDEHPRSPLPVQELEFVALGIEERLAALPRGGADLVTSRGLPLPRFEELLATPGIRGVARNGVRIFFLVMDVARTPSPDLAAGGANPFTDVRVRRALALGIDRQALAASPAVDAEALDQMVVPEAFGYDAGLPPRPYDPDAARRLLAQAGHGDGFDVVLDIATDSQEVLPALQRDLGELGIRVTPRLQRIEEVLDRVRRRDTSLCLVSWIGTAGDLGASAEFLLHTRDDTYGRYNGGGWSHPEADRLIEAAGVIDEPVERLRLLRELAALVHEETPVVPLLRKRDRYALREGLVFTPRLDRRILGSALRWER